MTTLFKILLGLLLTLITGLGLAPLLFDPNTFKEDITAQIAEATGLSVTIAGDLSLSLIPRVELEINDVSIANAPGFKQEHFARLAQARARVKWYPLLGGHLEVDRILARGLILNLTRNARGYGNWERLTRTIAADLPPAATETSPRLYPVAYTIDTAANANQTLLSTVSINAVELADARINWTDHLVGFQIILSELNGTTGQIATETPIALRLNGKITETGRGLSSHATLDTVLRTDRDIRNLTLSPMELHLSELTTPQGLIAQAVLTSIIEADLTANRYLFNGLTGRFTVGGPALSGANIQADLRTDLTLDPGNQTMQLNEISASSGALQLTGSLTAQRLFDAPAANGHLTMAEFDLRTWLSQQGFPPLRTADPTALTRVGLRTDWQLSAGQLDLQGLILTLDQTKATGWVSLLPTSPIGYRFDLEADALDLDRYRPPTGADRTAAVDGWHRSAIHPLAMDISRQNRSLPDMAIRATPKTAMVTPVAYVPTAAPVFIAAAAAIPAVSATPAAPTAIPLFPVESMRLLDIDGHLAIGELRMARLVFGQTKLHIAAANGRLQIKNNVERFYKGRIDGILGLSMLEALPALSVEQRASGIQAGPMLKDLIGNEVLTGTGQVGARLGATGQDLNAIKRSLNGELRVDLTKGVIKGFDLQQMISEAEARLTGKPAPPWRPKQTEYTTLSASAMVRDGVLHNDDLSGTSEYLSVSGQGRIDIANERLDYRLSPMLINPPEGRGIKEIEDIPIPVHLTGTFQDPRWNVELGQILRDLANRGLGNDLEKKAEKWIKKLEEKTGINGLEQGLRGLFGF